MLSLPRFAAGVSIPGAKSTNLGGNSETRYSMSVVFIYTLVDKKFFWGGVYMRSEVPPPLFLSLFSEIYKYSVPTVLHCEPPDAGVGSDEHASSHCQLHALCPAVHAAAPDHVQVSPP